MSVSVVLCYFSPAGYELPRKHFHATVQTLHAQGVPLVVTQAVLPGQEPQPVPAAIPQRVYEVGSVLWLKEALWNAAARLTDAEHLVFLDADIVFSTTAWLDRTLRALRDCDITQPFAEARWLDRDGRRDITKQAAAFALLSGDTPKMNRYHPGFAWAMTRDAFERLGGLYDRNACGGNDSALFFALSDSPGAMSHIEYFGRRQDRTVKSPSWQAYRENAQRQQFRFGVVPGVTVTHLWHGDRKHRQYQTREFAFPRNAAGEFNLICREDGILEWQDKSDERVAREYFASRREDG